RLETHAPPPPPLPSPLVLLPPLPRRLRETRGERGLPAQADQRSDELLRGLGVEEVDTVLERKPLGREPGGDDGDTCRRRLEDLEAGTGTPPGGDGRGGGAGGAGGGLVHPPRGVDGGRGGLPPPRPPPAPPLARAPRPPPPPP